MKKGFRKRVSVVRKRVSVVRKRPSVVIKRKSVVRKRPSVIKRKSVVQRNVPVYKAPTPVYQFPKPVYIPPVQPQVQVYKAPTPVYQFPKPEYKEPVFQEYNLPTPKPVFQVYKAPTPVYQSPKPEYKEPVFQEYKPLVYKEPLFQEYNVQPPKPEYKALEQKESEINMNMEQEPNAKEQVNPSIEKALTLVPQNITDLDFILETLSIPKSSLKDYDNYCYKLNICFINDFFSKNILEIVKNIQKVYGVKYDIKKKFNLTETDLSYKVEDIMPIPIKESDNIPIIYLFARLISYVKKLSTETNIAMTSDDLLQMYFDFLKNKPISKEAHEKIKTIHEHIMCEPGKKQTIYHFYITQNDRLVPDEHQPILINNNPNVSYNVVFIKQTENGYEPIDITCKRDMETVIVVSSIGYSEKEFSLLTNVLKDIDKNITKKESTILLHDTEYYVLKEHDFPHFRKVVNCYNKEFIRSLESKNGLDELTNIDKNLYTIYNKRKEEHPNDYSKYSKEADAWLDALANIKKVKSNIGSTNKLYKLINTEHLLTYIRDTRKTIDDTSLYAYDYFQKERKNSNLVTDTWWYRYFTRSLPCARGRVLQFSGTCWFNTVLNTMLLSTPIKQELKQITYSDEFIPYLKQVNSYGEDEYEFTYTTPTEITLDGDVPISKVLSHYEELRKSIPLSTFSVPFKAFFYARLQSNLHLDDKNLLSLSKLLNPSTEDGAHSYLIKNLFDILSLPYQYYKIQDENKKDFVPFVLDCLERSTKKFILIGEYMYCGKDSLPKQVGEYKLEAAGINSSEHAIIGLHCNDIPYMYDSNNVIAESNWPDIDFSGYYEKRMEIFNEKIDKGSYMNNFSFLLYCK